MAMISVFTAIVAAFALQAANGQSALPYDLSTYTNMLSVAPYFSTCDIPWYGHLDVSLYQQISIIASMNGMRPGDIIQWYLQIQSICPSYTDMNLYENLASLFRSEMMAMGIPEMPPYNNCNPLADVTPTTPAAVDPFGAPVSTAYDYAYRNMYGMINRSMPSLSPYNYSNLVSQLNSFLPADCQAQNPLLANRLATNMRYSLGLASRTFDGISYPFY